MPCPSCTHTMDSLGGGCFWCPRCGSLKSDILTTQLAPKIVDRLKQMRSLLLLREVQWGKDDARNPYSALLESWIMFGLDECIDPPEKRMQA